MNFFFLIFCLEIQFCISNNTTPTKKFYTNIFRASHMVKHRVLKPCYIHVLWLRERNRWIQCVEICFIVTSIKWDKIESLGRVFCHLQITHMISISVSLWTRNNLFSAATYSTCFDHADLKQRQKSISWSSQLTSGLKEFQKNYENLMVLCFFFFFFFLCVCVFLILFNRSLGANFHEQMFPSCMSIKWTVLAVDTFGLFYTLELK